MFSIFESLHSYVTTDLSVQQEPRDFENSTRKPSFTLSQAASKVSCSVKSLPLHSMILLFFSTQVKICRFNSLHHVPPEIGIDVHEDACLLREICDILKVMPLIQPPAPGKQK